jgi:hypothetical protein
MISFTHSASRGTNYCFVLLVVFPGLFSMVAYAISKLLDFPEVRKCSNNDKNVSGCVGNNTAGFIKLFPL